MMKSLLIDHPAKVVAIIALYLLSLVGWWSYYGLGFLLLFDGPRTPTLDAFLGWWWLYPIAVIFGIIFGLLSYLAKEKSGATIFFYLPAVTAVLLTIPVFVTEMQTRQANQAWFDAYWGDPPREIGDIDLSEVGFGNISYDSGLENIYILPDSVDEKDIIYWDGAVLVFETEKSFYEIWNAYLYAYQIMGLEDTYSFGSGGDFDSMAFRDDNSGDAVIIEILVSMSPDQDTTTVGILTCSRELNTCDGRAEIVTCGYSSQVGNFNC